MNLAVAVDHTVTRGVVHPGGTHVVIGTFHVGRPACVVDAWPELDLCDVLVFQLLGQQGEGGVDRVLDLLPQTPVDLGTAHAERVDVVAQGDAAVRIRIRLADQFHGHVAHQLAGAGGVRHRVAHRVERMREDVPQVRTQPHERRPFATHTLAHPVQGANDVGTLTRIQRAEPHLGIQNAVFLLAFETDAHLAGNVGTADLDLVDDAMELDVEQRVEPELVVELDHTVQETRVILEVAADQVVAVADAGALLAVGGQHQAGVFDTAGGQYEHPGLHGEIAALQGADLDALDRAAKGVALDFGNVGLEVELEELRGLDFVAIGLAHFQRGAELGDDLFDVGRVERIAAGVA